MKHYGLIGYPLGHSFSPEYFAKKFTQLDIEATYNAFESKHVSGLRKLVESHQLAGFNVTIPHKESIIPQLDKASDAAQKIGAVNCVSIEDGLLIGHNTDWIGFRDSLLQSTNTLPKKALILGSGGSSKAVQFALNKLGIINRVVSRNRNLTYSDLNDDIISDNKLIVNTTPVGMEPYIDEMPPIRLAAIGRKHIVFDLIYNPEKTLLLEQAEENGAQIINGYQMLKIQAEESWRIWTTVNSIQE